MGSKAGYRRAAKYMDDMFAPSFSDKLKRALQRRWVQEKIVHFINSTDKNIGIVLATSSGKTIIDVLLIDNWLLKNPKAKVLIAVPSVELAHQIKIDLLDYRDFTDEEVKILAGKNLSRRQVIWQNSKTRIFISTPQTIKNDMESLEIPANFFDFVIFDEAHHGVGDYAYTFLAEAAHRSARIVAQTATPGDKATRETSKKELYLNEWYTVPFEEQASWQLPINKNVFEIKMDSVWQRRLDIMTSIANQYYADVYSLLYQFDLAENLSDKFFYPTQKETQQLINIVKKLKSKSEGQYYRALYLVAKLNKFIYFVKFLFSEGYEIAFEYYRNLKLDKAKAGKSVYKENYSMVLDIVKECEWDVKANKPRILHPKLLKFLPYLESINKDHQVMICQNYVKSIQFLRERYLLDKYYSKFLIGHGHSDLQSAAERKKVRKQFVNNKFKLLQVTQIGREGMHFPCLMHIMFLSIPQTPQQQLQAEGRIGRTKLDDDITYFLFGPFDKAFYYANQAKVANMFTDIKIIPEIYAPNYKQIQTSSLPDKKEKFWAKELEKENGHMIKERFLVKNVKSEKIGKISRFRLTLQDRTGYVNATLQVKEKIIDKWQFIESLKNKVAIVSGKVKVLGLDSGRKLVDIIVNINQKQSIIACHEGNYILTDYYPGQK